ncbi:MAG TPA: 2-oxoglutarate and iron-dependent oxygenase domain-containing protein [Falsiroseomonas sp.]|jgi:isopenicillin N synthase-like dioxygenase|nr:2-oxoglutarate and iron-dependent oxygenase domain-containing protein [Falsiroseomonas sp.]
MPASHASTIVLATNEIPVLDLGPFLAGKSGALDDVARALYRASTEVGFYYVKNHGVPRTLVDRVFDQAAAFHALPEDAKQALKIDHNKIGYMGLGSSTTRHSALAQGAGPNLYEAFCMRHDLPPDDPDVLAGKPFRGVNRWPADLPEFRPTLVAYLTALENLGKGMLPIFARALDVAPDFFASAFRRPLLNLQLNHYPPQPDFDGNQFGIAPHTDRTFITILCQARVPGLEVRLADGRWMVAPVLPDHFLINTGDLLRRWTNDVFLSTPHRVINLTNEERHSAPFFFNPDPDADIACVPSCVTTERPARYPAIRYIEFYREFVQQTHPQVAAQLAAAGAPR